ncbi:syntaxin-61 [Lipomyces starkeyi]
MDSNFTSPTASRLLLLADNTLVSVLERNRLKSLDLEPSAAEEADIQRNLLALRDGIATLEREQSTAETDSSVSSRALKSKEDTLIRLQKQFDKLLSLLQDGGADKLLSQVSAPRPSRSSLVYPSNEEYNSSRSRLLNTSSPRTKTPKTVRFSDNLIDMQSVTPDPLSIAADEARNSASNNEALLLQQRIMQQQDDSLDRLSESISRQRELSIQIGDELDSHIELLGEVDRLVDWGQHRLDGARKRLDYVSRKTKENSSLVAIIVLIIVLLLLIIILKCTPQNLLRES